MYPTLKDPVGRLDDGTFLNHWLRKQISVYDSITSTAPSRAISIDEALCEIRDGYYIDEVIKARFESWNKALKKALPAYTFSGTFEGNRNIDNLVDRAGMICIDIDDVDNIPAMKATLSADPHVCAAFRSPTDGIKVLFHIGHQDHTKAGKEISAYLRNNYSIIVDKNALDFVRLCFVSYDPDLYINYDALTFSEAGVESVHTPPESEAAAFRADEALVREVQDLLSRILHRPDYGEWIKIISSVKSALPKELGLPLLREWRSEETPGEYEEKWDKGLDRLTLDFLRKNYGEQSSGGLKILSLSDVEPEETEWLWPGRLPKGAFVLVEGDPGCGKTSAMCDLVARLSSGSSLPFQTNPETPIRALLLGTEDSIESTLLPRLIAAGADRKNIDTIVIEGKRGQINFKSDMTRIEEMITDRKYQIVVIDGLNSFFPGVDGHKDIDVRQHLQPLVNLASAHGAVIIGIRHLRKSAGRAMHSGMGSMAYTAMARVVFTVGKHPQHEGAWVIAMVKNNLSAISESLIYRIEDTTVEHAGKSLSTTQINWVQTSTITADELTMDVSSSNTAQPQRARAEQFLLDYLADGRRLANDVVDAADAAGISKSTLYRAKKDLDIKSYRDSSPKVPETLSNPWHWELR